MDPAKVPPPTNKYSLLNGYSSECPYEQIVPRPVPLKPNPFCVWHLQLKVENLPISRTSHFESDLRVLFFFLSSRVLSYLEGGPKYLYYASVVGMPSHDNSLEDRHVIVETNCPHLSELLRNPKLCILADKNCFHVCWDGMMDVRGSSTIQHSAYVMRNFCFNFCRSELHRQDSDFLACIPLIFHSRT